MFEIDEVVALTSGADQSIRNSFWLLRDLVPSLIVLASDTCAYFRCASTGHRSENGDRLLFWKGAACGGIVRIKAHLLDTAPKNTIPRERQLDFPVSTYGVTCSLLDDNSDTTEKHEKASKMA